MPTKTTNDTAVILTSVRFPGSFSVVQSNQTIVHPSSEYRLKLNGFSSFNDAYIKNICNINRYLVRCDMLYNTNVDSCHLNG